MIWCPQCLQCPRCHRCLRCRRCPRFTQLDRVRAVQLILWGIILKPTAIHRSTINIQLIHRWFYQIVPVSSTIIIIIILVIFQIKLSVMCQVCSEIKKKFKKNILNFSVCTEMLMFHSEENPEFKSSVYYSWVFSKRKKKMDKFNQNSLRVIAIAHINVVVPNGKFVTNLKNHENCIFFHSVLSDDNTNLRVTNSASYNAFP